MISSLSISNYALIRSLQIEPKKGLNIITGETGAGKSIMLGAVGLLMGKRADVKALLDKEQKCVVEAEFDISSLGLASLFDEADLDYDDSTIIRREISPKGKSRAFINDVPVTLDVLKEIGLRLIDIHSQNESIQLGKKEVKLRVIDDYSGAKNLVIKYQTGFTYFNALKSELEALVNQSNGLKTDADYKQFQLEELTKAELQLGEQAELEEELNLLEHAEEIKLKLALITGMFEGDEGSINDSLRTTASGLKNIASFSQEIRGLSERFESATEEIVDVIAELLSVQDGVEYDPVRIDVIQQRLDLIYRLQQKHGVIGVEALIELQVKLDNEVSSTIDLDQTIISKKEELEKAEQSMVKLAEKLSEHRRGRIDSFCKALNELLAGVGMPNGYLEIAYKRVEPWKMGVDEIELLFTANKGINPEPVGNVASGGEFSRLMFCVKYLLAQKTAMPTVIFDEIDTGVSGEIAIKLAAMMQKMAGSHQLIAISHLPQVAAKGDGHYYVYKDNSADKTESLIRQLDDAGRLQEIAKMIGGDNPSEMAVNSAKELIG
ncbi:MAG: DNA repair protein RecN [Reichenbachiella sp.]